MKWALTRTVAVMGLALSGVMSDAQVQPPRGLNPDRQVDQWYRQYLRRPVDADGLRDWAGKLRDGRPWEEVLGGILGSKEYFAARGGTNPRYVRGLYRELLGRAPGNAEVRAALFRLNGIDTDTKAAERARAAVAQALLETPE
jgi:hypothetical protein